MVLKVIWTVSLVFLLLCLVIITVWFLMDEPDASYIKIFVFIVKLLQIAATAFLAIVYLVANHYVKKIGQFATDHMSKATIQKYIGVTYIVAFTYILIFFSLILRLSVSGLYTWIDLSSAIMNLVLIFAIKIELFLLLVRYTAEVRLTTKLIGNGKVVILGLDTDDREIVRLEVANEGGVFFDTESIETRSENSLLQS